MQQTLHLLKRNVLIGPNHELALKGDWPIVTQMAGKRVTEHVMLQVHPS